MRMTRGAGLIGIGSRTPQPGWWLGFRHPCWVSRQHRTVMRAVFIGELEIRRLVRYRRRYAIATTPCRHCRQPFFVQPDQAVYRTLLDELAVLNRLKAVYAPQLAWWGSTHYQP